jgi:hypothetical protein|nr:MAG TPA: protein of unknown function (DUF5361) [Caudoviricetes sp.]
MDLCDSLRPGLSYKFFLSYMASLPPHSKTKAAIANDKDLALERLEALSEIELRQIYESRKPSVTNISTDIEESQNISAEGFSLDSELLAQVNDNLTLLRKTLIGLVDSKASMDFKPTPRPKPMFEKLLDKRLEQFEEEEKRSIERELGF